MQIKPSLPTALYNLLSKNNTTGRTMLPVNEPKIKALSQDIFMFNNGPEPFVSYDSKGFPTGFSVHGVDISCGKEMTDDEKWEAIQEKYKGVPMFEKVYAQMISDMTVSGLITKEESYAAIGHLVSASSCKDIAFDMQNGILGDDPTPAFFLLVDFNELLTNVSDESKEYYGYNSRNDQRDFLKRMYMKMIELTKTERKD